MHHQLRFPSLATLSLALSAVCLSLTGGEAKAFIAWTPPGSAPNPALTYQTFDEASALGTFDNAWSPWLGDKRMKILNSGTINGMTIAGNDVEWSYKPAQPLPWHVDLDQQGIIDTASSFLYRVQIDGAQDGLSICRTYGKCAPYFYKVDFGIQATDSTLPTKYIYAANGDTPGALLATLRNGETVILPPSNSDIIVKIDWNAGNAVGDMFDDYNQAPAPLPILGAAAVFGSLRKIRNISTRLKTLTSG